MRFSELHGLGTDQSELDFVDVRVDEDICLFVDPYAIATSTDAWSRECAIAVNSFFQSAITAIRSGDSIRARQIFSRLHEPNETRLGYSSGKPSGRGVGGLQADQLLKALARSTAVQTGFVEDLADCELLVEGIGPDKISDITTNVIRENLVRYTQEQCKLFGVSMKNVASGPLWRPEISGWSERYELLPVYNEKKVLLVPKRAVRWKVLLEHREYYNQFVLNYLQAHAGSIDGLAHLARGRNGFVTKAQLKDEFPLSKKFLLQFSQEHPELFREYKDTKAASRPIGNDELNDDFDPASVAQHLIAQLRATPVGRAGETRFHRLGAGIVSFLFYPNLITPALEDPINQGRKRIDVTYVNTASSGIFQRFTPTTMRTSGKVVVEFKNYSDDPGNGEIDQVLGRFSDARGWLGLLICRSVEDPARMIDRCRDIVRDHRAYILCLTDEDLVLMLEMVKANRPSGVYEFIGAKFNALT